MCHSSGNRNACTRHRKYTQKVYSWWYTWCLQKESIIYSHWVFPNRNFFSWERMDSKWSHQRPCPHHEHLHSCHFLICSTDVFPTVYSFKEKSPFCQWVISQMADQAARLWATVQEIINIFQSSLREVLAWLWALIWLPSAARKDHIGFWLCISGADFAQMVFHSNTMHSIIFQHRWAISEPGPGI